MGSESRSEARLRRQKRVRRKVKGIPERPRLSVFKSARHIYAQIVDDTSSRTLLTVSSLSKDVRPKIENRGGNKESAAVIGKAIAERALEKGIKRVIFDRNGFLYHGRVKVLADAARAGGLEF
jgi:large subunit ribosomal protein L18